MKKLIIISFFGIISNTSFSQEEIKNYTLGGYLQTLEMVWVPKNTSQWLTMNTISNRIDFRWYPNDKIETYVGMRNIVSYGQIPFDFYPYMADLSVKDNGKLDLTRLVAKDSAYFLTSNIDRAYFQYTNDKFELIVGRQRINWGINLVWTPNDIFNSSNYFDFDYVERPGSDAILAQYYTGTTSSVQFAIKMDKDNKTTYAALYRFNNWDYDFQVLAGVMRDDVVLGAGWAGQIGGAGFVGEGSYFKNKNHSDSSGVFVASATFNYSFKKGLFLQAALLFNSAGTTQNAGQETMFALDKEISAKTFTRAKISTFLQASIPLSPLINASISAILNPNDKSGYIGPSIDISLSENIGFMLMGQLFIGNTGSEFGGYGSMLFSRLKWSF